jgi:hypothetical protein
LAAIERQDRWVKPRHRWIREELGTTTPAKVSPEVAALTADLPNEYRQPEMPSRIAKQAAGSSATHRHRPSPAHSEQACAADNRRLIIESFVPV